MYKFVLKVMNNYTEMCNMQNYKMCPNGILINNILALLKKKLVNALKIYLHCILLRNSL